MKDVHLVAEAKALLKKPLTAAALAKKLKVSKPTAYTILRGLDTVKTYVREGASGPMSVAYRVVR